MYQKKVKFFSVLVIFLTLTVVPLVWSLDVITEFPYDRAARSGSIIWVPVQDGGLGNFVQVWVTNQADETVWFGGTKDQYLAISTRDWPEGTYNVHYSTTDLVFIFHINNLHVDGIRQQLFKMMDYINENYRDENDILDPNLTTTYQNLIYWHGFQLFTTPTDQMRNNLLGVQHFVLEATAELQFCQVLGSGGIDADGWTGQPGPGKREKTMFYIPPNIIVGFPADAERTMGHWGYDYSNINTVLIPNNQPLQFSVTDIITFAENRSLNEYPPLKVYANANAGNELLTALETQNKTDLVDLLILEPGIKVDINGISVTGLQANSIDDTGLCLLIEPRGRGILYAVGTGPLPPASLDRILLNKYDIVITELSKARVVEGEKTIGFQALRRLVDKLRKRKCIDTKSRVIAVGMPKDGPQTLPDANFFEKQLGFQFAYDGMPVPMVRMMTEPDPTATPTPKPCFLGDTNCDGEITPSDALRAFEVYLKIYLPDGSESCEVLCSSDYNQDGSITPADALCIFKNYLGTSC